MILWKIVGSKEVTIILPTFYGKYNQLFRFTVIPFPPKKK